MLLRKQIPVQFQVVFFVYILENPARKLYVGHTDNLDERVISHNRTDRISGKFTRKNGPWRMVWSEEHETRVSAMAREKEIKKMKSSRWMRETLLNGRVPKGRD